MVTLRQVNQTNHYFGNGNSDFQQYNSPNLFSRQRVTFLKAMRLTIRFHSRRDLAAILLMQLMLALLPCPPARTGFSGLWPEIGKIQEKYWFRPPLEHRQKIAEKKANARQKTIVKQQIYDFLTNFLFWGRGRNHSFAFFSYFGPEAQKPRSSRRAGS